MRAALFVAAALALAGGTGVFAARERPRATALPSDAARYGFAVSAEGVVPELVATRPFEIGLANGPVAGRPASSLEPARTVVRRELARYPAGFLAKIRLAGIVLLDELTESGAPIPSPPNVGGLLLLDVRATERELVRTLHHELFHFLDLADDGKVGADPAWLALQPGVVYGSGGRTMRGAWAGGAADVGGFVSAYATSAPEEDKAETFAFAVARPAELGDDPIVRAKVADVTRRVAEVDPSAPVRLFAR